MTTSAKIVDPAFQGAGQKLGTEIWRIENFQPVPVPKSDYGKFYSGDSYIVLQTASGKGGSYNYDIHFWLGKDTSQDEAGTAAIKTVELDAMLGGRAVQHRELQLHETDKFLSYFKPCIVPLEGGVSSGFKTPAEEKFETRLYVCRGKRVVKLKQVPFVRSSLNHDDVFILDTENKIYQFNGANSNIQERAKALEVVQYFKDTYHNGKCDVAIIDDGKLQTESDSGEFWLLFGGFAPIGKKNPTEDEMQMEASPGKLYSIADGDLKILAEGSLSRAMLENNKCYLLDCGSEVFVWVGRATQLEERKSASQLVEEFIACGKRPKSTRITRVIQGFENNSFKSNFDYWPLGSSGSCTAEEGKGKVVALLKQKGVDVKSSTKVSPANEDIPLLDHGGKIEVWLVNGDAKTSIPVEDIGKFYTGDCYIVLYTYHSGEKRDEYFLCFWIGKESTQEDQILAVQLANAMHNSLKGRPVQARIVEGKEPPQFLSLFNPMVVLKGGISSDYKKWIASKGAEDKTYAADTVALMRISGTSVHDRKAVQTDPVSTSLSSTDSFILLSGSSIFVWHGNASTSEQHQLASQTAEFLKPGAILKYLKEGSENSSFWLALGGKQGYVSKKAVQDIIRDPHLYAFSLNDGKLKVTEVFNFSQDDLLTEDMMILDTHAEVFIWIGQSVSSKEKQMAFDIGQKYVELAASLEGISQDVPLYKVTEGNEPRFFTAYFTWDPSKASAQGNSFQKKLFSIFGHMHVSENHDKPSGSGHSGPTQRASAMAALTSAFNPASGAKMSTWKPVGRGQGSQRAAAVAALSEVLTAEQKLAAQSTVPCSRLSVSTEGFQEREHEEAGGLTPEECSPPKYTMGINEDGSQSVFTYDQLRARSAHPISGIDYKRREAYLSDIEFVAILGMTREAFYQQPKWKQDLQKRKVDLF